MRRVKREASLYANVWWGCAQYVVIASCGLMRRDNICIYKAHGYQDKYPPDKYPPDKYHPDIYPPLKKRIKYRKIIVHLFKKMYFYIYLPITYIL